MSSPYDLVGPVLPQALRLARYQASASLLQNTKDLTSENNMINQTPSREEERLLMSNANIMTALENLFSRRQKDRTSRTSKLSRVESVCFQRAMYRIWLMSVLYGPRRFVPMLGFTNEELSNREPDLHKSWKDQKSFLQQFSSQELFQISRLARFLVSTATWGVIAEGRGLNGTWDTYDWDGMFLFAGPHVILCCYEDATTTHLPTEYLDDDGPYTKFLTHALSEIIQGRRVTTPLGYVGTILDDINGEHDQCHHCSSAGSARFGIKVRLLPDLYNETNWDDLRGQLEPNFLVTGNLPFNSIESKPLQLALSGDWSRLLHRMFACRHDEYSQWSKENWICADCWSSFFSDTIWRWRREQKRKAGELVERDCKYGYNCEEQCDGKGLAHAKQFNHLCDPTEETPNGLRPRF